MGDNEIVTSVILYILVLFPPINEKKGQKKRAHLKLNPEGDEVGISALNWASGGRGPWVINLRPTN